ncbi:dehydrogenase/reductase SDR family [Cordyceps militaris CM01]|uniref:Short-chain dehydrogenase/reductase 3 n=2 Tax=Cordyceps militaris TaxID=73501 RepID=G3JPD9_CORMM|nr:dehydrogenase/reductase SDR family [Cordyceps militaris CM01]ATY62992.1 dehydrogenase reductase SDR family [Cordyceps militaris]EGX89749.1 dehydrogenase/reductase SDR family [Cordyceps militaris CM01]
MSGVIYALEHSPIAKAVGAVAGLTLNPLVTGALLAFLVRAPADVLAQTLQRASLPADYDLSTAKTVLKVLLGIGLTRTVNRKLSDMAANAWRWGPAPGWDWPREIAVVTGGCSGIGLAIVRKLRAKGIRVAVLDIQAPPAELSRDAAGIRYYKCDVTSSASVADVAAAIRRDLGDPTILVNNAGIAVPTNILDISEKALHKIFAINTMCHWITCQQFLPSMITADKGHVVTIASVASFVSLPGHADYGATKASALAFHEALRTELRHAYNAPNVLATVVHPNFVATPLLTEFEKNLTDNGVRMLTPEQVADATTERIFARKGGQVVIPKSSAGTSALRGWPTWIQVIIHDVLGAQTAKMNAAKKAASN